MNNKIAQVLADLEEDKVLEEVKRELESGTSPVEILDACQKGMAEVGERFSNKIYYVSDLMMSGEIFKQVSTLLAPALEGTGGAKGEKVVVGTVKGDIHDIGKDLVVGMLSAGGFDVIDVGVDAEPGVFLKAIKESGAKVLALSGLLTLAFDSMKETVQLLDKEGLRNDVRVMIGGGPVNEKTREYTGADAWGADAMSAVNLCKNWTEA